MCTEYSPLRTNTYMGIPTFAGFGAHVGTFGAHVKCLVGYFDCPGTNFVGLELAWGPSEALLCWNRLQLGWQLTNMDCKMHLVWELSKTF